MLAIHRTAFSFHGQYILMVLYGIGRDYHSVFSVNSFCKMSHQKFINTEGLTELALVRSTDVLHSVVALVSQCKSNCLLIPVPQELVEPTLGKMQSLNVHCKLLQPAVRANTQVPAALALPRVAKCHARQRIAPSVVQALSGKLRRSVKAAVVAEPAVQSDDSGVQNVEAQLEILKAWFNDGAVRSDQMQAALAAAKVVKQIVADAVNNKSTGIRGLQATVVTAGLDPLMHLAKHGHAIAFEALQILCYRNAVNCQNIVAGGVGKSTEP